MLTAMRDNIWITGAHGFIGQKVSLLAGRIGLRVVGLGHGSWPESERCEVGMGEWLNGDVSQSNLDILASRCGVPKGIVHLAGGSSVGPSLVAPAEDFRRTVFATSELLEWVRLRSPKTKVLLSSSAAVYGSGHCGPIELDAICTPYSPYGTHKLMSEMLLRGYGRDYGVCGAVVRLFSVYGPGLKKQLLWDLCGRLASSSGHVELGGSGAELRDWLHVDDAANLILRALAQSGEDCPTYNGGTGQAVSVRDVANWVSKQWGHGHVVKFNGARRAGDPDSLVADISSCPAGLNWTPTRPWTDGMVDYVNWYQSIQLGGAQ